MQRSRSLAARSKPYFGVLLYTLPALIFYLVYKIWPIVYSAILSFQKWNFISDPQWVGLANFQSMFGKRAFLIALENTGIYILGLLPFFLVFPLLIALLLEQVRSRHFQSFAKAFMFIPTVLAFSIICLVWLWIYNEKYGLLNNVLRMLGMEGFAWTVDKRTSLFSVVLVSGWKYLGSNMILFMAGLVNIPKEYIEAAQIDGASSWQCFWRVRFPLLSPTLVYMITTSIILASERAFAPINLLTKGGPSYSSSNLSSLIYEYGFKYLNIGMASTIALFTFALFILITVALNRVFRRFEV